MGQNTVKWTQVKRWLVDLAIDPDKRSSILARGKVMQSNGMLTPEMLSTVLGDDEMKGDFFRWKAACSAAKTADGSPAKPKDVAPHVWQVVRAFATVRGMNDPADPADLAHSPHMSRMIVTAPEVRRMITELKHDLPRHETTLGAIIDALAPKRPPMKAVAKVK